jgi:hypothetical protein
MEKEEEVLIGAREKVDDQIGMNDVTGSKLSDIPTVKMFLAAREELRNMSRARALHCKEDAWYGREELVS